MTSSSVSRWYCRCLCLGAVGCGPICSTGRRKPGAGARTAGSPSTCATGASPRRAAATTRRSASTTGRLRHPRRCWHRRPDRASPTPCAHLVADAARAAGIGVTDGAEAPPARSSSRCRRFWCTGYGPAYTADVTAGARCARSERRDRSASPACPLHVEDGGINCKRIVLRHDAHRCSSRAPHAMFSNPNVAGRLVRSSDALLAPAPAADRLAVEARGDRLARTPASGSPAPWRRPGGARACLYHSATVAFGLHLLDDVPPADAGVVGAEADLAHLRAVRDDAHLGAAEVVVEEILEPHAGDEEHAPLELVRRRSRARRSSCRARRSGSGTASAARGSCSRAAPSRAR